MCGECLCGKPLPGRTTRGWAVMLMSNKPNQAFLSVNGRACRRGLLPIRAYHQDDCSDEKQKRKASQMFP